MELFNSTSQSEPLASRMRPRTIEEFVGQDHILGEGRLLRRLIKADRLSSIILYGPPGTGKTTLAKVISNTTKSRFISLNAVLSGIKDLRTEIAEAKKQQDLYQKKTTLFIDEVHRWNKAQQDALLPWVENGTVILIGATTENPFFEVNPALVSRSRIFQLGGLTDSNLYRVAQNAVTSPDRGYGRYNVRFEEGALEHLVGMADGDARTLLNALELAVETSVPQFPPEKGTDIEVTLSGAEESIQKKVLLYDKEGDYHFDTISAFIKSIRGSDPDAALYWMARMVRAGEDPRYIFRRMLISASEDIGMADPMALVIVQSAAAAFDRIGLPEGQFHLTQSALYLATAKKSNSALGFFDALSSLEEESSRDIPNHLKDSNRDSDGFGHGAGYQYPHAFKDHWVAQQYLPKGLKGRTFYNPADQGYEAELKDEIERRRELQLEVFSPPPPELLTFTPPDSSTEAWFKRTSEDSAGYAKKVREELFANAEIRRHDRVCVTDPGFGSLLWEAVRRTPEGIVYCLAQDRETAETLRYQSIRLPQERRPVIIESILETFYQRREERVPFDRILSNNLLMNPLLRPGTGKTQADTVLTAIYAILQEVGDGTALWTGAEIVPALGTTLSSVYEKQSVAPDEKVISFLKTAEENLSKTVPWEAEDIIKRITSSGFSVKHNHTAVITSERFLTKRDIENWLSQGPYTIGETGHKDAVSSSLVQSLGDRAIPWSRGILVFTASI